MSLQTISMLSGEMGPSSDSLDPPVPDPGEGVLRIEGTNRAVLVITTTAVEISGQPGGGSWPFADVRHVYARSPAWEIQVFEHAGKRRRLADKRFAPSVDDAETVAKVRAALPKRVLVRRLSARRQAAEIAAALAMIVVVGLVVGLNWPKSAAPAAGVSWDAVVSDIQAQYGDVLSGELEDGLLMIRVAGDWTDLGATRLACETVKPILAAHGVGGQQFAIYDRHGSVLATGSRCP